MSRKITKKFSSFWPFPGGISNYVQTLQKALNFIYKNKPNKKQLEYWFIDTFPKVKSEKNAKGYVTNVLKNSGLLVFSRNEIVLSENGRRYLDKPSNELLFSIFNDNILGFENIIKLLGESPSTMDELHKNVVKELKQFGINWSTTYPILYRMNWFRSMGFVLLKKGMYSLTNNGSILFIELKTVNGDYAKMLVSHEVVATEYDTPDSKSIEKNYKAIISELRQSESDSSSPKRFELSIMRALEFLGYMAEHRGDPGETDVFARANLGTDSYSIILDGKTSKRNKISENQISWPTILDHKEQNRADFAIVVGPSFAGGVILDRSKKFDVLLMETSSLIELIEIHEKTPLSLFDLKEVFENVGLLNLTHCENLFKRKYEYEIQLELIPKILSELKQLQLSSEPTSLTDLRWALKKEYDDLVIVKSLEQLEHLEIIQQDDKDYTLLMEPRIASKKLHILADRILLKI